MGRNVLVSGLFFFVAILVASCASDTDSVVFEFKGQQKKLTEVKEAFNRFQYPKMMRYMDPEEVYKTDPWADADFETRKQFVETLTRKDLIIAFARDFYGNEFTGRDLIAYTRWNEKRITHFFWPTFSRDLGDVPQTVVDSLAAIRADQRKVTQIICRNEDDAHEIYGEISSGADFATVGRKYELRDSVTIKFLAPNWGDALMAAPALRDIVFAIREPGKMPPPIHSNRYGWHVVRIDSVRQADVSGEMEMITSYASEKWRQNEAQIKFDRIMADLDYRLVPENGPVLNRPLAAMWDSLFEGGASPDLGTLKAPRHRYTPEELALPICYRAGKPFTIGEFVASLDEVDIDYWPPRGDELHFEKRIENRIKRLAMYEEAKRIGAETHADYLQEKKDKIEELYLDIFEREYINNFSGDLTEDQMLSYWQADPARYLSPESVGYGFLKFPALEKDLALQTYQELKEATEWGGAPNRVREANRQIQFVEEISPEDGDPHPAITALALGFDLTSSGDPVFTQPLPEGEDWVILRIHSRQRPRQLSFTEATESIRRDLRAKAIDDSLSALLESLDARYDLKVNLEAIR
jgi:hypothetical protein